MTIASHLGRETFLREQLNAALERARAAERKLDAVRMLKVWTNEDGKRFVFADELFVATDPDLAARYPATTNPKEQL